MKTATCPTCSTPTAFDKCAICGHEFNDPELRPFALRQEHVMSGRSIMRGPEGSARITKEGRIEVKIGYSEEIKRAAQRGRTKRHRRGSSS